MFKLKTFKTGYGFQFPEIMGLNVNVKSYLLRIYDHFDRAHFSVFNLGFIEDHVNRTAGADQTC